MTDKANAGDNGEGNKRKERWGEREREIAKKMQRSRQNRLIS